jgi:hypothetical protein
MTGSKPKANSKEIPDLRTSANRIVMTPIFNAEPDPEPG